MFSGPVLVTGAAGFAGSHLIDALLDRGAIIQGWAKPGTPAFFDHAAAASVEWRNVDLLDRGAVHQARGGFRPSVIFHLAGAAHVGQSWQAVASTLEVNVMGTENLLEADRLHGLEARMLVTGSASVYRDAPDPLTEDAALAPSSPYAVSKLAQEQLAVRAARGGQLVFVTRPFNHIGPRQAPSFATASFAKQIARIERGAADPLMRVGNVAPRRDLTDVRDTVQAYLAIVERGTPGVVYNVCSGHAPRIQDVLDGLRARARIHVDVEVDPALYRPHDAPVVVGDHARLTRDTGWRPTFPLERTLDDLLAFWREAVARDDSRAAS